jgi:hypothetical protein
MWSQAGAEAVAATNPVLMSIETNTTLRKTKWYSEISGEVVGNYITSSTSMVLLRVGFSRDSR